MKWLSLLLTILIAPHEFACSIVVGLLGLALLVVIYQLSF